MMKPKTLTIVIPVYNEGQRVHAAFNKLDKLKQIKGIEVKTIRFVNDGSTDDTFKRIKAYQKHTNDKMGFKVEVISYTKNKGRGFAVRQGLNNTKTDYAIFVDADMSIPLSNLKQALPYMQQSIDVIAGSKKKPGVICTKSRGLIRNIVGFGHTIVATTVLGVFYWDFQGGFKIFSRKFIQEMMPYMQQERWGLDMEVLYVAKKMNYNEIEIPVKWASYEGGSKVSLVRDIKRSILDMIQIKKNWQPRLQPKMSQLAWLKSQALTPILISTSFVIAWWLKRS